MQKLAQIVGKARPASFSRCEGAPVVFLAPMSGVTDLGMRRAAQAFGADYVVSEMVDGDLFSRGDRANRLKCDGQGINCRIVQIAGCDAVRMAEAARLAEAEGADVIDINMGCPAKKVVGGFAGSALMRDIGQAARLINAVVSAVKVPVTLKMRLGWDERSINAPDLAHRAESEGVAMLTVHGRTRCQFYKGVANWEAIRAVVDSVAIPVIANGDCSSDMDARRMLAFSGAAGVMVGRSAVGRPWLVGGIARALATGGKMQSPSRTQRCDAAIEHYCTLLSLLGVAHGVRHARKHIALYVTHAGHPRGSALHDAIVKVEDPEAVVELLKAAFDEDAQTRMAA